MEMFTCPDIGTVVSYNDKLRWSHTTSSELQDPTACNIHHRMGLGYVYCICVCAQCWLRPLLVPYRMTPGLGSAMKQADGQQQPLALRSVFPSEPEGLQLKRKTSLGFIQSWAALLMLPGKEPICSCTHLSDQLTSYWH